MDEEKKTRPANKQQPMVQIALRLPEDLLERLQALAEQHGLATTSYLRMVLTKHAQQQSREQT